MSYLFFLYSSSCNVHYKPLPSPLYYTCGEIDLDVNGPNKAPATIGRDIFIFYVAKVGVYPLGQDETKSNIDESCPDNAQNTGLFCTYRVLTEGAMNY